MGHDGGVSTRPLRQFTADELRKRTSMKWRHYPTDILPMWVAEMDAPIAAPVQDVLLDHLHRSDLGYPAGFDYVEAYSDFAERRWGWRPTGQAVLAADVLSGIVNVLSFLSDRTKPVVINPPVYPPFRAAIELAGRQRADVPLLSSGRLDLQGRDDALTHLGPGATYLLCSPHNPTSVIHTETELREVAAIANRRSATVVVDEIHAPLVAEGFVPYLSVDARAHAVTSASKAFNLAGLKAALVIAGADAVDPRSMPDLATWSASQLGIAAHTTALREGDEWLDALMVDLDENRAQLAGLLEEMLPGVRWQPERGTYLAWLDFTALDLGPDPTAFLLENARVALNAGPSFGVGGEGYARLNYATTPELLAEGINRIARAVARAS
jgi:cysteine-S-conjugate beta-lyase